MLDKLGQHFDGQQAALELRAYRMQLLAGNITNADTPNYKAVDFNFAEALKKARGDSSGVRVSESKPVVLARTDPRHHAALPPSSKAVVSYLGAGGAGASASAHVQYREAVQRSIDGNTVDMDIERTAFAENAAQYQMLLNLMGKRTSSLTEAIRGDR